MSFQIIIRNPTKWKGKSVSEMQKNLVSEGWPSEVNNETLDRIKFLEKKQGRGLKRKDIPKLGKV